MWRGMREGGRTGSHEGLREIKVCGDSIALATEREGAWRQRRSGPRVCGLAPVANGFVAADDSEALRATQRRIKSGDGLGPATITAWCNGGGVGGGSRRWAAGCWEMGSLDVQRVWMVYFKAQQFHFTFQD